MNSQTCPRCGTPIASGQTQCRVCGADLRPSSPQGAAPTTSAQANTPADGAAQARPPTSSSTPPAPYYGYGPYYAQPVGYWPGNQGQGQGQGASQGQAASGQQSLTGQQASSNPSSPYGNYPYPAYPAYPGYGQYPPVQGQGQGGAPAPYYANPYGYQYAYPYGYYPYPYPMPARRPPGDIYALVISWIVIGLGALSVVAGLLLLALLLFAVSNGGGNLATLTTFTGFIVPPIIGGGLAIFYGITRVMHRSSPRMVLPRSSLFIILAAVAIVAGIVLWNLDAQGPVLAVLPLVLLSGILPALAILAYTSQQLGSGSTRRHVWLSLFYGATLAPLMAIILELILMVVAYFAFRIFGVALSGGALDAGISENPQTFADGVFMFISLSVIAPLVEEGLKPLGAVLIMRRLRTPAEAFLMGLAAGIGFDMVETIGYIGSGGADWITVAVGRIGAGLLHGVGAGFGALGWYYLINGKGVSHRWLRGFGAIGYAMFQHAFFNGSNMLYLVPGVGDLFSTPIFIGRLPIDVGTLLFLFYYALMIGLLVYTVRRLGRDLRARSQASPPAATPAMPALSAAGGAR